jgi:hypothetical protein
MRHQHVSSAAAAAAAAAAAQPGPWWLCRSGFNILSWKQHEISSQLAMLQSRLFAAGVTSSAEPGVLITAAVKPALHYPFGLIDRSAAHGSAWLPSLPARLLDFATDQQWWQSCIVTLSAPAASACCNMTSFNWPAFWISPHITPQISVKHLQLPDR